MSELVKATPKNVLGNFEEVPGAEGLDIAPQLVAFWLELDQARSAGQKPNQLRAIYDKNLSRCMAVWQAKVLMCLRENGLTAEDVVKKGCIVRSDFGEGRRISVIARSPYDFNVFYNAPSEISTLKYTPGARIIAATQSMNSFLVDTSRRPTGRYYVDFGIQHSLSIGKQEYDYDNDGSKVVSKGEHIEFNANWPAPGTHDFGNHL